MREALFIVAGTQEIYEVLDLGDALRGALPDLVEQDLIGWIHDIGSNGFLFSTVLQRWSARGLGDARAEGHKNCLWSLLWAMTAQGESNMGAAMTISKAACVDGDISAIFGTRRARERAREGT